MAPLLRFALVAAAVACATAQSTMGPAATVQCGLASPVNCGNNNRQPCTTDPDVCGPCLAGYSGPAAGNTPCDRLEDVSIEAVDGNLVLNAQKQIMFRQGQALKTLDQVGNDTDFAVAAVEALEASVTSKFVQMQTQLDMLDSRLSGVVAGVDTRFQSLVQNVEARAAGLCDGNSFDVWINGQNLMLQDARGVNVVEINITSVPVQATFTRVYDTHASKADSDALRDYLNNLPVGTVVAMGIKDAGTNQLQADAKTAIEGFGSALIREVVHRESWVMVGVKGAATGMVAEDDGGDPDYFQACTGGGRATRRVLQQFFDGQLAPYASHSELQRLDSRVTDIVQSVTVQSFGFCDGSGAKVTINGVQQTISVARGVNVYVINDQTVPFTILKQQTFDTHGSTTADADLRNFLTTNVHKGGTVLFAMSDAATNQLSATSRTLLESYGSRFIQDITHREAWAMIGVQGAAIGSVPEDHGGAPDPACTGGGRPTKRVLQQWVDGRPSTFASLQEFKEQEFALEHLVDTIEIQSAGFCDGNFFKIWINGIAIPFKSDDGGSRGVNTVRIDVTTTPIRVFEMKNFDTCCGSGAKNPAAENARLKSYLTGLPQGTVVLFGIIDEGVAGLDAGSDAVIESFGSSLIRNAVSFRESWAMIGVRGAISGTVPEGEGGVNPANNNCGTATGKPTDILKQSFFGGVLSDYNSELVRQAVRGA